MNKTDNTKTVNEFRTTKKTRAGIQRKRKPQQAKQIMKRINQQQITNVSNTTKTTRQTNTTKKTNKITTN